MIVAFMVVSVSAGVSRPGLAVPFSMRHARTSIAADKAPAASELAKSAVQIPTTRVSSTQDDTTFWLRPA
jgi:hypothetical protein